MAVKCDRCDNEAVVHEVVIKGGKHVEKHLCESCARESGLAAGGSVDVQIIPAILSGQIPSSVQIGPGSGSAAQPTPAKPARCDVCGRSFADFRRTGLLGCPACYASFESRLSPLLSREHEGATHHTGKCPARVAQAGQCPAPPADVPQSQSNAAASAITRVDVPRDLGPSAGSGGAGPKATGTGAASAKPSTEAARAAMERRIAQLREELERAIRAEQYEAAAKLRDQIASLRAGMEPSSGAAGA